MYIKIKIHSPDVKIADIKIMELIDIEEELGHSFDSIKGRSFKYDKKTYINNMYIDTDVYDYLRHHINVEYDDYFNELGYIIKGMVRDNVISSML